MRCSLIIPVYNAEKTIISCLRSALNQSLPKTEYEIILVDDGSNDNTKSIVQKYSNEYYRRNGSSQPFIRYFYQDNKGPAVARNKGVDKAVGDILVFSDSDCEFDFNFLERIITPVEENLEVIGVQGSYKTKQKEFMACFGQVEIETRYRRMKKNRYIDHIGTYAAAYGKDVFNKYGGFDIGFPLASGEDMEFSYKLQREGHKMVFAPKACVYHRHSTQLWHYLKVKFFRGFWKIRLHIKHPKKALKDSYTPQGLKFQTFLNIPLFFIFAGLSFFETFWLLPLALTVASFLLYAGPFLKLFREKQYSHRVFIPFVLFLRAVALFFGALFGAIYHIRTGSYKEITQVNSVFDKWVTMDFKKKFFRFVMVAGDIALMHLSVVLVLVARSGNFSIFLSGQLKEYIFYLSFTHILWMFFLFILDLYKIPPLEDIVESVSNLFLFLGAAFFSGSFYFYFLSAITPKTILFADVLMLGMLLFVWRSFLASALKFFGYRERIMIIGTGEQLKQISPNDFSRKKYDLTFLNIERAEDLSFLTEKIVKKRPDLIVLALKSDNEKGLAKEVFAKLPLGLNYISFKDFYENFFKRIPLDSIDEVWFFENLRKSGKMQRVIKRGFDFVFSLIGLVLTAILFPLVAIFINRTSPGPIFYKQERVGRDGKIITLYKFRTMQQGSEKNGSRWTNESDSRVTAFGKFLRVTHIDEFPQFFNILKGDISFVGPRPEWLELVKLYRQEIPFYDTRQLIKPGLTGWAQLKYRYSTSVEEVREKLKYDLYYIKHRNFAFDLGLILKTIKTAFRRFGKQDLKVFAKELKKTVPFYKSRLPGLSDLEQVQGRNFADENLDILIADDEKVIQDLLGRFLGGQGYSTLSVSTGREALDKVKSNNVRMAIVDVRLAGLMNGIQLLKRIKQMGKDIAVIVITGFGTDKIKRYAQNMGVRAYLEKPFDLAEIKKHVESALSTQLPTNYA